MKATGLTRPIDNLGRVVVPKELRYSYGLGDGELIDFYVDKGIIILQKHVPSCTVCGKSGELIELEEIKLCHDCLNKLNDLAEQPPF